DPADGVATKAAVASPALAAASARVGRPLPSASWMLSLTPDRSGQTPVINETSAGRARVEGETASSKVVPPMTRAARLGIETLPPNGVARRAANASIVMRRIDACGEASLASA